ncbi:hypothetical protein FBQ96_03985, partial [Nitrospirales bacterium NOB]|nr:hypothetical protein [Nitrospirales bacterium NOB]
FTYTVTVTNPAASPTQTGVTLYDPIPVGLTASGSATLSRSSVADAFASAAYNLNVGTRSWTGSWTEAADDASASTGKIQVSGGELRLGNVLVAQDNFDTNGSFAGTNGTAAWNGPWVESDSYGGAQDAAAGGIRVAGNQLRLNNDNAVTTQSVTRGINLTNVGATQATLYFTCGSLGAEAGDNSVVQYRLNGTGGFTTLETYTAGVCASPRTITVPSFPSTTTSLEVRFAVLSATAYTDTYTNERFWADNVTLTVTGGTPSVSRSLDLTSTGATQATLTFDYRTSGTLGAADDITVQSRTGGSGGWTTLGTFTDDVSGTASYAIPLASPANLTEIRFAFPAGADYATAGQYFFVDDLSITYDQSVTAAAAPNLLSSSRLYALAAGQSLTATFDVTVNDPFPTGQTEVTNVAATTTVQLPIQITATRTDPVENPTAGSASAGGRLWFDVDGDGAQDVGESGFANVEVVLKDRFGTPVATAMTDGNGRYLFTGVEPGTGYYVEAASGLPPGLVQTFPTGQPANRTTPFDLVDGQTYTQGDIGYRTGATTAAFGDRVWVDADGDGVQDTGEIGLGGVAMSLYRDANGDGFLDPGVDTLVATTTTDPDGSYLFTGASATGVETYFVSAATPSGYLSTNGTVSRFQGVSAGSTYLTADFGFNATATTYSIRDRVWLDLAGWRPSVSFWRGRQFLSQQGDPEYAASNFPEFSLSKIFVLGPSASIEFGMQARRIRAFFTEDGITYQNRDTFKWVNQQYLLFNWNWDTADGRFFRDLFPASTPRSVQETAAAEEPRFTAKLDALTYVYHINYSGLDQVGGRPVSNSTFAGQYLAPVLRYSPSRRLNLDIGFFAGLPVADTQRFHTVQPILSAEYELWPAVSLVAGTIKRNHPFVDALFDDARLFSRPVEQGFQLLVDREHYQQDLFINWYQLETFQKAERFDVGYSGRVKAGWFSFNGQVYWIHSGGAQYSESRTFFGVGLPRDRPASNNFLTAVGPQFTFQPSRYWPGLSWFREVDVMALYLTSQNEPTQAGSPIVRGRGYQLTAGVNLDGWRPYVTLWRGEGFVNEQGDPAYYAGHFTEFGLLKYVPLPAGLSLRLGGFGRIMQDRLTHTEYLLLNWSWDESPWRGFCLRPTLLHRGESTCSGS